MYDVRDTLTFFAHFAKITSSLFQVLIDSRDCSVVTHRESVTYLGNHSENNTRLYSVPGLDYVAHEDIMPYR